MTNRKTHLFDRSHEHSGEHRLVYEERTGAEVLEKQALLGPRYKEVVDYLKTAATEAGQPAVVQMLENPDTLRMIAAQVDVQRGEVTKKWMNTLALKFLEKTHEAFTKEPKIIENARDSATKQATACADIFKQTLDELKTHKEAYPAGVPATAVPWEGADPDAAALRKILTEVSDQKVFKDRFDKLIGEQMKVLKMKDDAERTALLALWKENPKEYGLEKADFTSMKAGAGGEELLRAMLDVIQKAAVLLDTAQQEAVRKIVNTIDAKIAESEMEEKRHIMSRFEDRIKYLDRLGGTNIDVILDNSIGKDGKFYFSNFEENLTAIMGGKPDAAHRTELLKRLELGDGTVPKAVTAAALENAKKYLQDDMKLVNPTGVDLSAIRLRALIPEGVVKSLNDAQFDANIGVLIEISKLPKFGDGGSVGAEAAKIIAGNVIQGTNELVSKELLIDYLAFIAFGSEQDVIGGGTIKIKKGAEANKWAAEYFDKILLGPSKAVKHRGDTEYIVDRAMLETELAKIKTAGKTEDGAKKIYDELFASETRKIDWKKSAKMHASEVWKITKAGTEIWWNYIKNIPRDFWDKEGDPNLLRILNQQKALGGGKAALEKLLTTSVNGEGMLKKSEKDFREVLAAQAKALNGDAVTNPREHQMQAHALELANLEAIRILKSHGWESRVLRLRQLTLWISMNEGDDKNPNQGIEKAKGMLEATASMTPAQQEKYVDDTIRVMERLDKKSGDPAKFTHKKDEFLAYLVNFGIVQKNEGRDILLAIKERGLTLKPDPLTLLTQAKDPLDARHNLAAGVGRWLIDPPGQVATSLALILEDGDAKNAYLQAFTTGKPKSYEFQSRTEKVTAGDAHDAVDLLQQHIQHQMKGVSKAREELAEEDPYGNPIDKWLHTGVDAIKDLWRTDMIGKVEVIAMAFAAFYLIREAWKTKAGKVFCLGIPILLGVNTIVKQRTGRDLMGENLQWKGKKERQFPLEQFRRRAAVLDKDGKYASLTQPSGQAALRALMDEKKAIPVRELLAWRKAVKDSGGRNFKQGVPPQLNIGEIRDNLGEAAPDKAYEVAFYAFEALCADVGRLNGTSGGSIDDAAEQGADLIQRRYVDRGGGAGERTTMFDVLISESLTPSKDLLENLSYVEWLASWGGVSVEYVTDFVKRYGVKAFILAKEAGKRAPEYYEAGKEKVLKSADAVWDWMRETKAKLWPEMTESFKAAWKLTYETAVSAGLYLKETAPGVLEWVYDESIFVGDKAKDIAMNTYRTLMDNGVTGSMLESLGKVISKIWGDIDQLWLTPEYREKLSVANKFAEELLKQVSVFAEAPSGPGYFTDLLKEVSADAVGTEKEKAPHRLAAMEQTKRRVFSFLAAERIHELKRKMDQRPPDTKPLVLPIRAIAWPQKLADFDAKRTSDSVYKYLYDNYQPEIVLAAIGNQQTFIGLMRLLSETDPNSTGGKLCSILLYPELEKFFSRDSAADFMMDGTNYLYEIKAYIGNELAEAKKNLSDADFQEYQAYVNTVLTNVMFETILSSSLTHTDLRLLKQQAKDFRRHLLMRRGALPKHTDTADWKLDPNAAVAAPNPAAPNLKQFNVGASPASPEELDKLSLDPDFRWLLLGEKEPEKKAAAPAATPAGAPGAAPAAQPPLTPAQKQILQTAALDTPDKQKKVLEDMVKPGLTAAEKLAVRQKFDALPAPVPALDPTEIDRTKIHASVLYFLGVTDGKAETLGRALIDTHIKNEADSGKLLTISDWLKNVATDRSTFPNHPRLQRLLDEAAMTILVQVAKDVGQVKIEDLKTNGNTANWRAAVTNLLRITEGNNRYGDAASRLLEYIALEGDFTTVGGKTAYDRYKEFLTSEGIAAPPTFPNRGAGYFSYNSDCETRLIKIGGKKDNSFLSGYWGTTGYLMNDLKESGKRDWQ